MRHCFFILVACFLPALLIGQYEFSNEKSISCTGIKNQARTGTCWSFSTVSFLESELMRQGKSNYDLSEMFIVRTIYKDKARNYVLRQGKANFSQGSLSHDVIRGLEIAGIVPESVYSGLVDGAEYHDHSEMVSALKGMLDGIIKGKRLSDKWPAAFENLIDTYLGEAPETFTYEGKTYSPQTFAESLGLDAKDYVTLTSYNHHPFYSQVILELPDNYSNGSYFNIPLDELQAIADYALSQGYTVAWDGDVSEKGFSAQEGIAVLPVDESRADLFEQPGPEVAVVQKNRQRAFESFSTTDDHLMHLTGVSKDQQGNTYYITKNSWGERSRFKGYLHMSVPYFRMKTVGIMVHKDAIPEDIAKKLNL